MARERSDGRDGADGESANAQVEAGPLELASPDGSGVRAFAAGAVGAGVVILPDIRGLTGFYEELARGFGTRDAQTPGSSQREAAGEPGHRVRH